MSSSKRGVADVLRSVVIDLRSHRPLVDQLPHPAAIYQAQVTESRDFPVEVTISPVYEGSSPHRGMTERNYRVQATVKATYGWREARDSEVGSDSLLAMYEILDEVANRLDRAPGIPETSQGGEGGPNPMEMDDGRLAVIGDWRLSGWYADEY